MGDNSRRRLPPLAGEGGEDYISGLPDELLHVILLRLHSISAAARTSVLSHRWRCVWTFLPQLILSPEDENEESEEEDKESKEEDEGSEEEVEGQEEEDEGSEEEDEEQEEEDEGQEVEDEGSEEEDEGTEEEDEGSEEEVEDQEQEDEGSEEEDAGQEEASSFPDTVDAVLATSAAPTIELLSICVPVVLTAQRIAPWLRFAAERVTGEFSLTLASGEEMAELELPACGKATSIELDLSCSWMLRSPTGVFSVLTCLGISFACMDGRELSDLVSTRCPRLKKLDLIVRLAVYSDVSIHSDSMHLLRFSMKNARRLDVIAPRLKELCIFSLGIDEIQISAPTVANVSFKDVYNPRRHLFTHVSSRLHLLEVGLQSTITPLMKQFEEVDELRMRISIPRGIAGYKGFMDLTNRLSKCETLRISLWWNHHGLIPAILHLLRCCNSIKKLSINLTRNDCVHSLRYSCPSDCPCRLAEGYKIDDIALLSLEEVQIVHFYGSQEEMEFVEQLSRFNAPVLKKLGIFGKSKTPKAHEKVRCLCRPNLKVEFYRELHYVSGGLYEG